MRKRDAHAARRKRLARRFKAAGIDGLLVTDECNVRYLSGFTGEDSALLVALDRALLLTDGRFDEQAAHETKGLQIRVRSKKGLMEFAAREARKADIATLGVEAEAMSLTQWEALKEKLRGTASKPTRRLVTALRVKKDAAEVRKIALAARIAEEAFLATVAWMTPGRTELEVARQLDRTMEEMGADRRAFPTIVAAGPRSSLPHARPTHRRIRKGDAVLFDWGACVEGYHSDLTRLVFLAKIPEFFKRLYDAVLGAQRRAIARLRPGRRTGSVDASARAFLKARRLNKYFTHGLGHGLGLRVHEAPVLGARGETTLQPGMVCTVEPGVYVPGRGGVRIEDDVLITRRGHRLLTTLPKTLDAFLICSP